MNEIRFGLFTCVLLLIIFNSSCTNSTGHKEPVEKQTEKNITAKPKPGSNFSDTLKINSSAAVFYGPDSLQLEKIKSITDARIFEGSMHEYYYLMRYAHLVIKRDFPSLKIIEAKNVRYLLFISTNNSVHCIDLNTKSDAYGLFIFNRQKPPVLVDMANVESDLGFYFAK